jgi:DNA (cytosine-5)-methyltransferase 1
LVKFVAKGDRSFIAKYYSGKPEGKVISTNGPAGTVTCIDSQSIVNVKFILKYNSTDKNGNHNAPSVEEPCPVITTQNRLGVIQASNFLMASNGGDANAKVFSVNGPCRVITTSDNKSVVKPEFLSHYYGNGFTTSPEDPCPTITTKDRAALIQPKYFIYREFKSATNTDIEEPAGAITCVPKLNLVKTEPFVMNTNFNNVGSGIDSPCTTITANRKWHYIINPSWGGHSTSVDDPCVVIVARQDKAPLYLTEVQEGELAIAVYEHDTPIMIKIKEFMAIYGLVDIKMRMLRVPELLRIQGFPDTYKMVGNQSDHKKFIGNSVESNTVKAWIVALGERV